MVNSNFTRHLYKLTMNFLLLYLRLSCSPRNPPFIQIAFVNVDCQFRVMQITRAQQTGARAFVQLDLISEFLTIEEPIKDQVIRICIGQISI